MSAVLEWLKTFLMLYFFLTLILYCAKEILSEVSAICSKNDTFSGGVPATVKPGQQRRGFFFTGRGI